MNTYRGVWRCCVVVVLTLICWISGCTNHRERIPVYPQMSAQQTLEMLRSRANAIHTLSGQGTLRLSSADGQSVMLDTAIALEPQQNEARIRAWKFGQAVFDLTVIHDGVYVVAPRDSAQREQILKAGSNASRMIHEWLGMMTGALNSDEVQERGNELIVREKKDAGTSLLITIDRLTATPRVYRLLDSEGRERFSLMLSDYAESNTQV